MGRAEGIDFKGHVGTSLRPFHIWHLHSNRSIVTLWSHYFRDTYSTRTRSTNAHNKIHLKLWTVATATKGAITNYTGLKKYVTDTVADMQKHEFFFRLQIVALSKIPSTNPTGLINVSLILNTWKMLILLNMNMNLYCQSVIRTLSRYPCQ